jgi:hypothetical protein
MAMIALPVLFSSTAALSDAALGQPGPLRSTEGQILQDRYTLLPACTH